MTSVPATNTDNSAASAANTQAQQSLNSNYTDFLQLLTTQMQNQDPTNPADTNQITQEIAQLSQVQGQIQTNDDLAQLISLFSTQINNNAVSYIGKQVDSTPATGSQAQIDLSSSQGPLVFTLPAGASSSTVTITNSAGNVVYTGPGTTVSGRNQMVWGGGETDSKGTATGVTAPDGVYNFTVTAADANGKALTATTYTSGTVQAVDTQSGNTTLSLGGGLSIPVNNVTSIYTAGTNPGS